ncbi:hypothetical protein ACFE04_003991 [Oxalis oulophora]
MNLQQAVSSKSSSNGLARRKEGGNRLDNRTHGAKSNAGRIITSGDTIGGFANPSRDRLVYLITCLIGHPVEVQVKNGSVYTGIYHATNTEKDFGVILKMACMIKDGTAQGQKTATDFPNKAPSKTLIIQGKELVQVKAKDVAVTRNGLSDEFQQKQPDLMLDSSISQSCHVDLGRELSPWVPDDDQQRPELENIFENPCNRKWNQFETNEALFGVKSTFSEEFYTTKLERGPQMRELEKEAMRIAREIEGEDTQDLHLAEERGIQLHGSFDIDEETRFSSVSRGVALDDNGYEGEDDILLDSCNTETFGGPSTSDSKKPDDLTWGGNNDGTRASSSSSLEHTDGSRLSKSEASLGGKIDGLVEVGLAVDATVHVTTHALLKSNDNTTSADSDSSEVCIPGKIPGETQSVKSNLPLGSSRSSSSECVGVAPASTRYGLSPSSSVGSLSSEKSTLNPHAKEFKFNPNAKSFTPSPTVVRPPSPVSDGSFYYPNNVSTVPHMQNMHVGFGVGPSYPGQQPVIFNPQVAPPQAYFHPNGPQYGQHMLLGQSRQVVYMPNYQPEMAYKGREY